MSTEAPHGPATRPAAWMYAWWLLVGGLLGLGTEGLLTVGVLLLPLAAALALIGLLLPALRNGSATAILAGIGASVLYLAWLNRGGPGEVCETTTTELSCVDAYNPWVFVVVAVLLVAASMVIARRGRHIP